MRPFRQPAPSPVRQWVEPIAVGAALDGALIGIALLLGGTSIIVPLLLIAVAAVLGWRYGLLRGGVGACLPLALLMVAEIVREALGGTGGAGPVSTLLIGIAAIMFLAFAAFLASAIRGRYRKPKQPYTSPTPWRS